MLTVRTPAACMPLQTCLFAELLKQHTVRDSIEHIVCRSCCRTECLCCGTSREADLTAAERFGIAREAMRKRDAADRAAQREARRQKKVAKKERFRARAADEAGAAAGPQLARPAEASSEGDTSKQSPPLLCSMKAPGRSLGSLGLVQGKLWQSKKKY